MTTKPEPPRTRHDGWTLERQATFLATLEATGSVRAAAGAAGMNRGSGCRLRERPGGSRFAQTWDLALARHRERLLQERLAKATRLLVHLGKGDEGDTRLRPHSPRESDKGDTGAAAAPHRQASQTCRLSHPLVIPGLTRDPPCSRRQAGPGSGPG